MRTVSKTHFPQREKTKWKQLLGDLRRDKWMYMMLIPGVVYFLIYKYGPMWFLLTAFKDYQPFTGFFGSPWVGFKHFQRFFGDPAFKLLFRNTLALSLLNLVFNFPMPIIFALMINEVKFAPFKRTVQTIIYMPHFLSWTIICGMVYILFTTEGGLVNEFLVRLGRSKVNFLMSETTFRPLIVGESMWRNTGWGTIIYLAAISNVDAELYEAARIDGANRFQQLWSITFPSIKPTIVTLLILRLGDVMDTGFDQIFNTMNALNRNVADVFDTYVYNTGIVNGQLSYSTAVGLFKSVVGFILVVGADRLAKYLGEEGIL